jgi:hypothetical protein
MHIATESPILKFNCIVSPNRSQIQYSLILFWAIALEFGLGGCQNLIIMISEHSVLVMFWLAFVGVQPMMAHRIETIVKQDRTLTLENLPFHSGEQVEVIIFSRPRRESQTNRYPLRGTIVQYTDPIEPVGQDDWEVTQ